MHSNHESSTRNGHCTTCLQRPSYPADPGLYTAAHPAPSLLLHPLPTPLLPNPRHKLVNHARPRPILIPPAHTLIPDTLLHELERLVPQILVHRLLEPCLEELAPPVQPRRARGAPLQRRRREEEAPVDECGIEVDGARGRGERESEGMPVDAAQEVAVLGGGELGATGRDEGFLGGGCVGAGRWTVSAYSSRHEIERVYNEQGGRGSQTDHALLTTVWERLKGLPKTTPSVHEPLPRQLAHARTLHDLGDDEQADILEIDPDVMEIVARAVQPDAIWVAPRVICLVSAAFCKQTGEAF